MRVYLGPATAPRLDEWAAFWRGRGYEVVTPLDVNRAKRRTDDRKAHALRVAETITDKGGVDMVATLSKDPLAEVLAKLCGLPLLNGRTFKPRGWLW